MSIHVDRKRFFLGSYDFQEDAARAYDSAALYFFGEYAYINFPDSMPAAPEEIRARVKHRQKGYTVYFEQKPHKWGARIDRKGFDKYIGSFGTKEEALRAGEATLEIYRNEINRCKSLIIEETYGSPSSPVLSLIHLLSSLLNVSLANPMNPLNPNLSIGDINFHFNL